MFSSCTEHILSEDYSDYIVEYELASDEELEERGICYNIIDSNFKALYLPHNQVPENLIHLMGYKVLVRLYGLMDTESIIETGIDRLRKMPNFDLRGSGVLIGFVDTGIDYTHKAFRYGDGSSKIVSIWDQTIQSDNKPNGLNYGTEYIRDEINLALQSEDPYRLVPSKDDNGHGTFLAGIAAGNPDEANKFSGVATDAEIVVVKLKPAKQNIRDYFLIQNEAVAFQENDIMLGIRYLVETARRVNRPMAICIGLGTTSGSHDSRGAMGRYTTSISQQDGLAIVVAAGNEGNRNHHYEGHIKAGYPGEVVELNIGKEDNGVAVEIWSNPPGLFALDLMSPTGEMVQRITPKLGESREASFIFEQTRIYLDMLIVGSRTGAQLALIRFQNPTVGLWRITVNEVAVNLDLNYHIWLPQHGFVSDNTYFLNSDPHYTLTTPGNSDINIVITAYDSSNGTLYFNAGRGYTRDNEIAPDVAAPGVNMIGPYPGNIYTAMTGTSVAAAHTTGVAAMLLEWGIVLNNLGSMDGIDIKNLLIRGAKREKGLTYPNQDWGYGILDIISTFQSLRGI